MYCFTYYMLHAVITHDAVIGFNKLNANDSIK